MLNMPDSTNEDNMHQRHDIHVTASDLSIVVHHSVSVCCQQIAVPGDFHEFSIHHLHWHEHACRDDVGCLYHDT